MAGLLLAAGVASAAVAYILARSEASELLDYQMKQLTRVVAAEGIAKIATTLPANDRNADVEDDFVVYVWDRGGHLAHRTPLAPPIERPAAGFSSISFAGERWRIFSETVGQRQFAVAQRLDLRNELAGAGALQALIPVFALIPLLGFVIGWIVLRSLKPLRAASAEVERRPAADLRPLAEQNLPEEVRPLLHAMNGLLSRLDEAMMREKRFVADAAHELRTPLAALQLQAEMLEQAGDETERRRRVQTLRSGIARLSKLVSQLLTLARLDAAAPMQPEGVDLLEAVKAVIAELYPLAEARSINLGLSESDSVAIRGDPAGLRALFANLLDNALRYTPQSGQIDVSVRRHNRSAVVTVEDTGPGIPREQLERVFDRFVRAAVIDETGTGLGLAIARAAAERHHARIQLENRTDRSGLRAAVVFPL